MCATDDHCQVPSSDLVLKVHPKNGRRPAPVPSPIPPQRLQVPATLPTLLHLLQVPDLRATLQRPVGDCAPFLKQYTDEYMQMHSDTPHEHHENQS